MKRLLLLLLILSLSIFTLCACSIISGNDEGGNADSNEKSDVGSDKGEDNGTSSDEDDDGIDNGGDASGSSVTDPNKLRGQRIVSALLSSDGIITVTVTDGSTAELGRLRYYDGGKLNVEYEGTVYSALGITGFEVLGEGGLTILVGEERFDCVGRLVCRHGSFGDWSLTGKSCTQKNYIRYCEDCGTSEKRVEEYDGHDVVSHPEKAPSCKEDGYEAYLSCGSCDYTTYKKIEKISHTLVEDKGYPPTENEYGLSDGSHCSVCLEVITAQRRLLPTGYGVLDNYSGSYGYDYLGTMESGEALQAFYKDIDDAAEDFHSSTVDLSDNTVAVIGFGEYGISSAEALMVYSTYRNDNPLYYWLGSSVSYTETEFRLLTEEEYRLGEVRAEYNDLVYSAVKKYTELAEGYESIYHLTLILHDGIINGADYAYEEDGKTPKDGSFAHNVLGTLVLGEGVCESYARAFQLILNYSGIENIFVSGDSRGEAHAWNLVKLDDGEYYWYDLTWDDTPGYMLGISYNYFAVDDDSILSWRDFGWTVAEELTFISSHTPTGSESVESAEQGLSFLYALPDRADAPMALSELRITFAIDGISYVRISADSVQVIALPGGDAVIPETVTYGGREYKVAAIGSLDDTYILGTQSVGRVTTSVHIPSSVRYIADRSLAISTLGVITVDENNPYFASSDGILFTKNMLTLVKYPENKTGSSYVIPDSVLYVAFGGMDNLGQLSLIEVGENLRSFGYASLGYPYVDNLDDVADANRIIEGELEYIQQGMAHNGEVDIDENNPNFAK